MITRSDKETIECGVRLSKTLKKGDVVALYGELGSGKTTFTKGIGKGLGVKNPQRINSPTFVLIKQYEGRMPLYHLDLYRLDNLKDIEDIAVEEYLFGDGVSVIEWPERLKNLLPKKHVSVRIAIKDESEREVSVEDFRD